MIGIQIAYFIGINTNIYRKFLLNYSHWLSNLLCPCQQFYYISMSFIVIICDGPGNHSWTVIDLKKFIMSSITGSSSNLRI